MTVSPDLDRASDTGRSGTDNITNDTTPFIAPAAPVDADVTVIGTATNGSTTVTCSFVAGVLTGCDLPLSDGEWDITYSYVDAAGNTSSASTPLHITIDTSAPNASGLPDLLEDSDSGVSSSDNKTNETRPEFSANGGKIGETITIYATRGTQTFSCSYVVGQESSCRLPELSDGSWTIRSSVSDLAGNESPLSEALELVVGTSIPKLPLIPDLSVTSDTGQSQSDKVTKDTTPLINIGGLSDGTTVTVFATKDGQTFSCQFIATNLVKGCVLPALSNGTWNIHATFMDEFGNESEPSSELSILIGEDVLPDAGGSPLTRLSLCLLGLGFVLLLARRKNGDLRRPYLS